MALLDELRKHGTRAFVYLVVEGWGPRLNCVGVGKPRNRTGWGSPVEPAYKFSTEVPLSTEWDGFESPHPFNRPDDPTVGPGEANWIACLEDPGGSISESWDLRRGTVSLGQFNANLIDVLPPADDGYDSDGLLTDLLAARKRVLPEWELAADMTATQHHIEVTSGDSLLLLQPHQVLWIGREAVRVAPARKDFSKPSVTINAAGGGRIDLTYERVDGVATRDSLYTTLPAKHLRSSRGGDGAVCDHPSYTRNREATLYLGVYSQQGSQRHDPDGDGLVQPPLETLRPGGGPYLGATSDSVVELWRGEIADWEQSEPTSYRMTFKPLLGKLDRMMGSKVFRGTTRGPTGVVAHGGMNAVGGEDAVTARMAAGDDMSVLVTPAGTGNMLAGFTNNGVLGPYVEGAGFAGQDRCTFHARVGDMLMQVYHDAFALDEAVPREPDAVRHSPKYVAEAYHLLGTGGDFKGSEEANATAHGFHEVLCTHPAPSQDLDVTNIQRFTLGGANTTHPVHIALMMIVDSGEYAVLPEQWRANVPLAQVDIQSFRDAYASTQGGLPGLVFGWEGEAWSLRRVLEEQVLGPFGLVLYLTASGQIAIGKAGSVYPGDTVRAVTESHILDPPGATQTGNQSSLLRAVTIKYDHDRSGDRKPEWRTLPWVIPQNDVRHHWSAGTETFEMEGLLEGHDGAAEFAAVRGTTMALLFHEPPPIISLEVPLEFYALHVTAPVALTVSTLGNMNTGQRGHVETECLVVGRSLNLNKASIGLDLIPIPDVNTRLWAPSAKVHAKDSGAKLVVLIEANEYTDGEVYRSIPQRDATGFFSKGDSHAQRAILDEADAWVMLRRGDGFALADDGAVPVVGWFAFAAGIDALILGAPFASGGVEVKRPEGSILDFCHYGARRPRGDRLRNQALPTRDWTDYMLQHAASADLQNLGVGTTTDEPHEYGA